jgi:iron(III) transport system permease protein
MIAQVFLAVPNENATVLDKETSLAFIRAAGDERREIEAMRSWADGGVSLVNAWVTEHARTVLLIGALGVLDAALLWILMLQEKSRKVDFKWILILLIVDFLVVFQLLPLVYLLIRAFFPEGEFSLEIFRRLYGYSMNWQALTNTVTAATCTMVLGTIIAYPLAYLVGRTNLYGRRFFRSLFVMTYMVPPYVGAMAWLRLLNRNVGTINLILRRLFSLPVTEGPLNIYSLGGLIWVLTTFYFPYAFITISRAMEKMDPTLEEASRISGASPFRTVLRITLPIMTPSLIAGALLVFVCAASCYGIPSIIGAPGNVHTVTTRIIEYYGLGVQGVNDATGLAFCLILIALVVLYISDFVVAKKQYVTVSGKSTQPASVDLRKWRIPLTAATTLFAVIAVAVPFATILVTSFKVDVGKSLLEAGNFTMNQWGALIRSETLDCLKNSLIFGAVAATVGTVISCVMSYLLQRTRIRGRKLPDFLITLGSGTPSVVIALGLIMTMRGQYGVDIYNTAAILIIAYLIKYLMMGMRTVSSAMSQIHVSLEESSQISGAGWLRTMTRITGPLILPSIAAGWFLIFIPCFYELSMTTLLYTSDTKTIGFQLYQYWTFTSQPQACAMASGILLFVVALNFVLNKLTKGEFTI